MKLATKLAGWSAGLAALLPLGGCELALIGAAVGLGAFAPYERYVHSAYKPFSCLPSWAS